MSRISFIKEVQSTMYLDEIYLWMLIMDDTQYYIKFTATADDFESLAIECLTTK